MTGSQEVFLYHAVKFKDVFYIEIKIVVEEKGPPNCLGLSRKSTTK